MKICLISLFLLASSLSALEYEVQIDNERVCVSRVKIMPSEEIGEHRDAMPQVVIALQGGTITRLEADGTTNDVVFPTATPIFRDIDPPGQLHKSLNRGPDPIELLIIQIKPEQSSSP